MIPAFEVGASIVLDPKILQSLEQVIGQFKLLDDVLKNVQSSLDGMAKAMRGVASDAQRAARSWENAARQMSKAANAGGGRGSRRGGGGGGGGRGGSGGSGSGGALVPYGPGYPLVPYSGGGGGGGGGGPLGPHGGGAAGGESGGGPIDLGDPRLGGGPLNWNKAGGAYMIGSAASQAQSVIFGQIQNMFQAGARAEQQRAALHAAGVSNETIAAIEAQVLELSSQIPGLTIAGGLKSVRELRNVFGDSDKQLSETRQFLPALLKAQSVFSSLGVSGDAIYDVAKAAELQRFLINKKTGQVDPATFQKYIDTIATVTLQTGGKVGPADFLQFARNAGAAGISLTPELLFTEMPTLMMALGASRAGTGVNALMQMMGGGVSNMFSSEFLRRMGLLPENFKENEVPIGRTIINTHKLSGWQTAQTDPVKWVENYLMPALAAHGYKTAEQQAFAVYQAIPQRTAQRLTSEIIANQALIAKDRNLIISGATTSNAAFQTFSQTPEARMTAMMSAIENFYTVLAGPNMQSMVNVLNGITSGFSGIGGFFRDNPNLSKLLLDLAAGMVAFAAAARAMSVIMMGSMALQALGVPAPLAIMTSSLGVAGFAWMFDNLTSAKSDPNSPGYDPRKDPNFPSLSHPLGGLFTNHPISLPHSPNAQSDPGTPAGGAPSLFHKESYTPNGGMSAMPVYIINVRDLYHGIMHGMSNDAGFPPIGPTEHNSRLGQQTGGYVGASI